ncbi:MAG: FxsA family protein [Defluviicoccus sp.]|nr:FxsA family protein [Defluviicoccus sp.]MDE0384203.1 FxsA family protein [Defluviicoccus sp.]
MPRWLPWSFWLFLFLPVLDVWLSLSLYGMLGIEAIMGLFVGTWLLGGWIFSRQTAAVVGRALTAFRQGELPADEIRDPIGLVIAAALLATPGVVTDIMGFALLTPRLRLGLMKVIFEVVWGSIVPDLLVLPPPRDRDDPDPARPDDF